MGTAVDNSEINYSATGSENICIAKGDSPLFMISDKSEKELLAAMGVKVLLLFWGGLSTAIVCFAAIGLCFLI